MNRAARASARVAVIPGDGIGPELVASALEVLTVATRVNGPTLEFGEQHGGARVYAETGEAMTQETLERLRTEYDAILKGPVGLPDVRRPDGTEGGLLGGVLRLGLDTYANVRPIRLLAGVSTPVRFAAGEIDYVIVRENTEGLYLSRGASVRTHTAAADTLLVTRQGCERISRFAFELARSRNGAPGDGVRRVTCVDKSNVLASFAFFREVFDEVATDYPDITTDHRYADAAAHDLLTDPGHFDVVVTENFLGDVLSDLGAATIGGLGMCGSANIGASVSYFEPIHGSAPTIAGTGTANPTSQILSAAMMLDQLGAGDVAEDIRAAVAAAFADGAVSLDERGRPDCGTDGVTRAVVERLPCPG